VHGRVVGALVHRSPALGFGLRLPILPFGQLLEEPVRRDIRPRVGSRHAVFIETFRCSDIDDTGRSDRTICSVGDDAAAEGRGSQEKW
jgi:hypothetical protein